MVKVPAATQKVLVLYILLRAEMPLSASQLARLTGENGWMNYFDLHQYLAELADAGLICPREEEGKLRYYPAADGAEALEHFKKRVSPTLREQVDAVLEGARDALNTENDLEVTLKQTSGEAYEVRCVLKESGEALFAITLYAPNLTQALKLEQAFRRQAPALYEDCMLKLGEN